MTTDNSMRRRTPTIVEFTSPCSTIAAMRNWLAVLAAALFAPACYSSNAAYPCMLDTQCTEIPDGTGMCVANYCSYPSPGCDGMGRYGSTAGSLSGTCAGDTDGMGPDASNGSGSNTDDAGNNNPPADAAPVCYGTGIVKVCFAAVPTTALAIDTVTTIDTTSSPMCATNVLSGGDGYCVVIATDITINATLRGTGAKPLVLVASGSIAGTAGDAFIDVSSKRTGVTELGAGHDFATCKPAATAPKTKGGGAGASFIGKGGDGGKGVDVGGTAGDAITADTVTTLRGGCGGQDGDGTAGSAGHGGGAIFMIAKTKIDFAGTITAGGEGGLGAAANKGGGGGAGTGGMIGFDAPSVRVINGVYANGGGGGEGISAGNNPGNNGEDALGTDAARGGDRGSNSGGDGGNGSSITSAGAGVTGLPGSGGGGGGGGGGGEGLIKAPAAAVFGGKVSPLPTP